MREKSIWIKVVLFTILSSVLFFCHLYAFGFYAIVVIFYEIAIIVDNKNRTFKKSIYKLTIAFSQFIIPTILYCISPNNSSQTNLDYASIYEKIFDYPFLLFSRYKLSLDKAIFLSLIVAIGFFLSRRKLMVSHLMILPIAVLIFIYFLLPYNLSTGANTDWRLLVPLSLLILSSINLLSDREFFLIITSTILMFLFTLNIYMVNQQWMTFQDEYQEIIALLENIEEGSRLFFTRTYSSYEEECYPFMHAPNYAIIKKSAFVPSLFAFGTQQPVKFNKQPVSVIKNTSDRLLCPKYSEPIYQEADWKTIIKQYDYILISRKDDYQDIPEYLIFKISAGKNYALYKTKES